MSAPTAASAGRRATMNPTKSQNTPNRSPTRPSTSASASSPAATNTKSRSVRTAAGSGTAAMVPSPSARAAVRKSVSHTRAAQAETEAESDARAEATAAMEDLRQRLQKAELATEEHMKHAATLQAQLEDATSEQKKLEESAHEQQERMQELENENKENIRRCRELENIYEAEQAAVIRDREDAQAREEELRETVQRLKENLAQRDLRVADDERRPAFASRSSSFRSNSSPKPDGSHFAPPLERSSSRSSSRLVMQKDKIIESLRLELAETQIKIAELETMGGGRMHELERALMEAKVANGRLMEDNEGFQLLLSEKTLHGDLPAFLMPPSDFERPASRDRAQRSSLADELVLADSESVSSQPNEVDPVEHRRLLSELSSMRDQNKALSLYINNIITRLLQHKEFENILDKTPGLMSGPDLKRLPSSHSALDKDTPPAPPPKDATAPSLLQRAASVVSRGRPRPQPPTDLSHSHSDTSTSNGLHEDPITAPRIPLTRPPVPRKISDHRRSNPDWSHATVVANMYRGPSPVSPSSGQVSPGSVAAPLQRANTFFGGTNPRAAGPSIPASPALLPERRESMLPPSTSHRDSKIEGSTRNSFDSNGAGAAAAAAAAGEKPSGAIMGGNKMRPLRLVQEANEEEEARKKANRSSWMGWFNKGGGGGAPLRRNTSGEIAPPY